MSQSFRWEMTEKWKSSGVKICQVRSQLLLCNSGDLNIQRKYLLTDIPLLSQDIYRRITQPVSLVE